MPNWCENKLTVIGDHKKVFAFMVKARGNSQFYGLQDYEFEWEKKRQIEEGDSYKTPYERILEDVSDFSFHALYPIPSSILKLPYDPNGIQTERKQWGVKWGSSEAKLISFQSKDEVSVLDYEYNTPWGPAVPFLEKVSKDYSDLLFLSSYKEECPTRGRFTLKNGKSLLDIHDQPPNKCSYSWNNLYYRTHNKWVKDFK